MAVFFRSAGKKLLMTQHVRMRLFSWMGWALAFSLSSCTGSVVGGEDASCTPGTYASASGCLPCTEAAHCGAQCQDCTALSTNRACVDGACGCTTPVDCAPGEWCVNGVCGYSTDISLYVVPPIRDSKILPNSGPPATTESYEISVVAALGEFEPASFVIRPQVDLSGILAEATPLTSASGAVISADAVDLRVVKCWWQAGVEVWGTEHQTKVLTPELLLKDDALVKVEGGENYLRLNGEYTWISAWGNLTGATILMPEEFPVQDAATLQPFDVPAGTNKQVWITIQVPPDAEAGTYQGFVLLRRSSGEIGRSVWIQLKVLPFSLAKPRLTYSLYYYSKLNNSSYPNGSISSEYKSDEQLRAEFTNMLAHGVTNPTVSQWADWRNPLVKYLGMRRDLGMNNQPLYFLSMGTGSSSDPAELQALKQRVQDLIALATPYGITDVFIYGRDEATGADLTAQRQAWQAVHEAGGKVFVSGYIGAGGNFDLMGDLQDLLVCAYPPRADEAAKWHSVSHRIFNYGNPQAGMEQPERYRRNYGLLLWQQDYDGVMDFAYQFSFGSIWNDFDHVHYRDHLFTYPTVDGVIDTIEWEGFREGADDVRYLTTLLNLVDEKKAEGKDTSFTEDFLAQLKVASLADMDGIRAKIIRHILCLRGEGPCCGNGIVEPGESCDGENLADNRCATLGFSGGEIRCKDDCSFDTCGCTPSQISISFADPTPAADSIVTGNAVKIGTSLESSCGILSAFINWNDSLVGYWDFNENEGGTASDKSSHDRSCTINGATWAEGKFGSALRFDGVDDSVECVNLEIPENGPATIEGWFYFTEFAAERGANIPLVTGLYQSFERPHPQSNEFYQNQFYLSGTDDYFPVASLLRKNEWFHLVLTYAGDTGSAMLYVNAVPVAIAIDETVENIGALSDFSVGRSAVGSFKGLIDEIRVWNRVLSGDEIQASYDARRYGLRGTFDGLQNGQVHCYSYVSNALGQSAKTETRTFTIDVP
jgi:hypothetical protein